MMSVVIYPLVSLYARHAKLGPNSSISKTIYDLLECFVCSWDEVHPPEKRMMKNNVSYCASVEMLCAIPNSEVILTIITPYLGWILAIGIIHSFFHTNKETIMILLESIFLLICCWIYYGAASSVTPDRQWEATKQDDDSWSFATIIFETLALPFRAFSYLLIALFLMAHINVAVRLWIYKACVAFKSSDVAFICIFLPLIASYVSFFVFKYSDLFKNIARVGHSLSFALTHAGLYLLITDILYLPASFFSLFSEEKEAEDSSAIAIWGWRFLRLAVFCVLFLHALHLHDYTFEELSDPDKEPLISQYFVLFPFVFSTVTLFVLFLAAGHSQVFVLAITAVALLLHFEYRRRM